MDVDKILREFQSFLNINMPMVKRILALPEDGDDLLSDWMQANWEILVESILCKPGQFFEIYGEGADCNGKSSRVCQINALPTHKIFCSSKTNEKLIDRMTNNTFDSSEMSFYSFVSWNGKYSFTPPLNYVLLESKKKQAIVLAEEVIFKIAPI